MAKIQPWYKVVTPREDLREGKPLDAAEFAVHLDQVRDGKGSEDYSNPARFFERTFLTKNLGEVASQVVRRLSGEKTATSAVFNMSTQFGGGKTHALTLLYHLATQGPKAANLAGVEQILEKAGVTEVPLAATAVFVGTEFDSIQGRGGDDGTPLRKTPWGEIAYQLGGVEGFNLVAAHEQNMTSPGGDAIRKFLPKDRPALILIDELLNYISRNRKSGLTAQLYDFLQNLSETARGSDRVVLVASIPASELEMNPEDRSDFERFKKLLDRVGKAVIMSAESETSEIIRRRLFEWDSRAVAKDGRVLLSGPAVETCREYADWLNEHRAQIPAWFPIDHGRSTFEATYPFHPMVLSVFERKWQELPRFQQTRGVLRLLALWVSHAYQQGFTGAHKDPLIGLGTAPLEDALFRSAVFEQLGEDKLEGAVTTDITGKPDAHAIRLDHEAVDTIKKARLHRKVATTILFESNGGRTTRSEATVPEIRLAVCGPDTDLGNVETVLDALLEGCYYLTSEQNRFFFSLKENLNKRFADRRANIKNENITTRIKEEIEKVFSATDGVDRKFFPDQSAQIPDLPSITLVIIDPDYSIQEDPKIRNRIEAMTREYGKSARTYKSALLWVLPESSASLREEARKLLAWEDIREEGLKLEEPQQKQLTVNIQKSRRDLTESVWRTYKNVFLLGRDNTMQLMDMGLVTSSAAETLPKYILAELRRKDEVVKEIPPRFLLKNWPPAFTEWSTKSVRDAFYASPLFPRLLFPDAIRETIARGVNEGLLAYGSKTASGAWDFPAALQAMDVEISEDVYLLTPEEARKHKEPPRLERLLVNPSTIHIKPASQQTFTVESLDQFGNGINPGEITWTATGGTIESNGVFQAGQDEGNFLVTATVGGKTASAAAMIMTEPLELPLPITTQSKIVWSGDVAPQRWSQLYMKVLTKLVAQGDVKIQVRIEASPKDGVTDQQVEETKTALRGLGMDDTLNTE